MKTMICQNCGNECERTSAGQKYCPDCRLKIQEKRNATYLKRKLQQGSVGLNEETVCAACGKTFIKKSGHQIYCSDCGNPNNRSSIWYANMAADEKKSRTKRNGELYDRLSLYVPKGKKQELQALAMEHGMSLNQFVNLAIQQLEEELRKEPANNSTQE